MNPTIRQFMVAVFCTVLLASCAVRLPERSNVKKKKPKNHISKMKECVDAFMNDHGVGIEEAFNTCEKIYRR